MAGEWADDRRTGHGHYFYANGDEYIGDWQNHLRHGQGRYMYASSGLQYEGQWRDGKRTGDGEISRIGGQSVRLTHIEPISDIVTLTVPARISLDCTIDVKNVQIIIKNVKNVKT